MTLYNIKHFFTFIFLVCFTKIRENKLDAKGRMDTNILKFGGKLE